MNKTKKIIFNTIFLVVIFGLTIYGVFHGEDLGAVMDAIQSADKIWFLPGVALVAFFYMGRVNYYILYDAYAWYSSKEMEMFPVFLCRFFSAVSHHPQQEDSRRRFII